AKIKGHILFVCVLLFLIDYGRDSNKGGLPYGKLQPFGEWLQSPWATSVSEAIGALRRKNPLLSAKIDKFRVRLVDFTFSLLTLHFSLFSAADFGGFFFLPFIHPISNTQSQISVNGRFRGQKLRGLFLFF
ncbi:MAG: hypothetical protein II334_03340, partial [Clostridia bacterium]|nr:hypothetical protein [Clostridia bacterium]